MDLFVRIPNEFKAWEMELRSDISKRLERGKIDLIMSVEMTGVEKSYTINASFAKKYFDELQSVSREIQCPDSTDYMKIIMKMPDILIPEKHEMDKESWTDIRSAFDKAIQELILFRENEGKALEKDIYSHIEIIKDLLIKINPFDSKRIAAVKERLKKHISEFLTEEQIDSNRFEQEMVYYLEKIDFTEEKVRLKTQIGRASCRERV